MRPIMAVAVMFIAISVALVSISGQLRAKQALSSASQGRAAGRGAVDIRPSTGGSLLP